jgi:hypothetical protein
MSNLSNISGNSSFTSIRYAPSSIVVPDASNHENIEIPLIDIAALRCIARIVKDIKAKIAAAAGNTPGIGDTAGDPSGSTITSANRGTDISGKKKR